MGEHPSEEQEIALGRKANAEVLKEYTVYPDKALQSYVQEVGRAVAANSHRPELIYRFAVVDSKEVNAFALPGGYIYITRGMLAYLNSESELAAVLGHEVGHVTARHSVRQYSTARAANMGLLLGSILLPQLGSLGSSAANQLLGLFGNALLSGYGREHELEADRLGAEYLARSNYGPEAMLDVIGVLKDQQLFDKQLAAEEGRKPRAYHGLFASHPDHDTRLQDAVRQADRYRGTTTQGKKRDAYLRHLQELIVEDAPHEGILRGNAFYHPELGFGLRFPPGWSLKNRPDRILAIAPGGKATLQLAVEDLNRRISPRDFMLTRLHLTELSAGAPIAPSDLDGYTALALLNTRTGSRQARVNVVYFDDKAYVIAGFTKDQGDLATYDQAFLDTANSFHPLSEDIAKPLRLDIIEANTGTTFAQLAKDSPFPSHAETRLRLLNDFYPDGEPQAGQLIKVVK